MSTPGPIKRFRLRCRSKADEPRLTEAMSLAIGTKLTLPVPVEGLPPTPGVWLLHQGGRANVLAVRTQDGQAVAVKVFHDHRGYVRFRNVLGFGKWRRIVRAAAELERRNVPHARVLGFAEWNGLGAAIMEYVSGYSAIADLMLAGRSPASWKVASALGRFTGRLHRAGVTHGDFSLRNVLLGRKDGRIDLLLADLEDARFHKGVASEEQALADIRHLAEQMPVSITVRQRVRFLARYKRCAGIPGSLRDLRRRYEGEGEEEF